jgi:hypothetical protein
MLSSNVAYKDFLWCGFHDSLLLFIILKSWLWKHFIKIKKKSHANAKENTKGLKNGHHIPFSKPTSSDGLTDSCGRDFGRAT